MAKTPRSSNYFQLTGSNRKKELYDSFAESSHFHDPFSPINLFLSKKIRHFLEKNPTLERWNAQLQEKLIEELSPEFYAHFPKYRLNVSALKKLWEKVFFYRKQIEKQKEALNSDGTLNIDFLLSENLKQTLFLSAPLPAHPFYFATQVARQLSECVAILDGRKIPIDKLTQKVLKIQKLLIAPSQNRKTTPLELDPKDLCLLLFLLDLSEENPSLSCQELKKKASVFLQNLSAEFSSFAIQKELIVFFLETILPQSENPLSLTQEQERAAQSFIKRHLALLDEGGHSLSQDDKLRRLFSLYQLAAQLPKGIEEKALRDAILVCYPTTTVEKPALSQQVFAFIAAEIVLLENERFCHSQEHALSFIKSSYEEAIKLCAFPQASQLEALIAKTLIEEREDLPLSPLMQELIHKEFILSFLEYPHRSFSEHSAHLLTSLSTLKEWALHLDKEEKMEEFLEKSDIILKELLWNQNSFLFEEIKQHLPYLAKEELIETVANHFEQRYPFLSAYRNPLRRRLQLHYKWLWYNTLCDPSASGLECFLKWHVEAWDLNDLEAFCLKLCTEKLPSIPPCFVLDWCKEHLASCEKGP